MRQNSGLFAWLSNTEVDGPAGHHGGDGVFVDHLRHGIAQQHHVLVKGLDMTLEFDAVDEVNRHRHVLFAQQVQKWILQELAFVAHDMFRVE